MESKMSVIKRDRVRERLRQREEREESETKIERESGFCLARCSVCLSSLCSS